MRSCVWMHGAAVASGGSVALVFGGVDWFARRMKQLLVVWGGAGMWCVRSTHDGVYWCVTGRRLMRKLAARFRLLKRKLAAGLRWSSVEWELW